MSLIPHIQAASVHLAGYSPTELHDRDRLVGHGPPELGHTAHLHGTSEYGHTELCSTPVTAHYHDPLSGYGHTELCPTANQRDKLSGYSHTELCTTQCNHDEYTHTDSCPTTFKCENLAGYGHTKLCPTAPNHGRCSDTEMCSTTLDRDSLTGSGHTELCPTTPNHGKCSHTEMCSTTLDCDTLSGYGHTELCPTAANHGRCSHTEMCSTTLDRDSLAGSCHTQICPSALHPDVIAYCHTESCPISLDCDTVSGYGNTELCPTVPNHDKCGHTDSCPTTFDCETLSGYSHTELCPTAPNHDKYGHTESCSTSLDRDPGYGNTELSSTAYNRDPLAGYDVSHVTTPSAFYVELTNRDSSSDVTGPQFIHGDYLNPLMYVPATSPFQHHTFKRKRKRSRTGIPRPRNAFMIYSSEQRPLMQNTHASESNSSISVRLGQAWRNLTVVDQAPYYHKSKVEEIKHRTLYPDYKYTPRPPKVKPIIKHQQENQLDNTEHCGQNYGQNFGQNLLQINVDLDSIERSNQEMKRYLNASENVDRDPYLNAYPEILPEQQLNQIQHFTTSSQHLMPSQLNNNHHPHSFISQNPSELDINDNQLIPLQRIKNTSQEEYINTPKSQRTIDHSQQQLHKLTNSQHNIVTGDSPWFLFKKVGNSQENTKLSQPDFNKVGESKINNDLEHEFNNIPEFQRTTELSQNKFNTISVFESTDNISQNKLKKLAKVQLIVTDNISQKFDKIAGTQIIQPTSQYQFTKPDEFQYIKSQSQSKINQIPEISTTPLASPYQINKNVNPEQTTDFFQNKINKIAYPYNYQNTQILEYPPKKVEYVDTNFESVIKREHTQNRMSSPTKHYLAHDSVVVKPKFKVPEPSQHVNNESIQNPSQVNMNVESKHFGGVRQVNLHSRLNTKKLQPRKTLHTPITRHLIPTNQQKLAYIPTTENVSPCASQLDDGEMENNGESSSHPPQAPSNVQFFQNLGLVYTHDIATRSASSSDHHSYTPPTMSDIVSNKPQDTFTSKATSNASSKATLTTTSKATSKATSKGTSNISQNEVPDTFTPSRKSTVEATKNPSMYKDYDIYCDKNRPSDKHDVSKCDNIIHRSDKFDVITNSQNNSSDITIRGSDIADMNSDKHDSSKCDNRSDDITGSEKFDASKCDIHRSDGISDKCSVITKSQNNSNDITIFDSDIYDNIDKCHNVKHSDNLPNCNSKRKRSYVVDDNGDNLISKITKYPNMYFAEDNTKCSSDLDMCAANGTKDIYFVASNSHNNFNTSKCSYVSSDIAANDTIEHYGNNNLLTQSTIKPTNFVTKTKNKNMTTTSHKPATITTNASQSYKFKDIIKTNTCKQIKSTKKDKIEFDYKNVEIDEEDPIANILTYHGKNQQNVQDMEVPEGVVELVHIESDKSNSDSESDCGDVGQGSDNSGVFVDTSNCDKIGYMLANSDKSVDDSQGNCDEIGYIHANSDTSVTCSGIAGVYMDASRENGDIFGYIYKIPYKYMGSSQAKCDKSGYINTNSDKSGIDSDNFGQCLDNSQVDGDEIRYIHANSDKPMGSSQTNSDKCRYINTNSDKSVNDSQATSEKSGSDNIGICVDSSQVNCDKFGYIHANSDESQASCDKSSFQGKDDNIGIDSDIKETNCDNGNINSDKSSTGDTRPLRVVRGDNSDNEAEYVNEQHTNNSVQLNKRNIDISDPRIEKTLDISETVLRLNKRLIDNCATPVETFDGTKLDISGHRNELNRDDCEYNTASQNENNLGIVRTHLSEENTDASEDTSASQNENNLGILGHLTEQNTYESEDNTASQNGENLKNSGHLNQQNIDASQNDENQEISGPFHQQKASQNKEKLEISGRLNQQNMNVTQNEEKQEITGPINQQNTETSVCYVRIENVDNCAPESGPFIVTYYGPDTYGLNSDYHPKGVRYGSKRSANATTNVSKTNLVTLRSKNKINTGYDVKKRRGDTMPSLPKTSGVTLGSKNTQNNDGMKVSKGVLKSCDSGELYKNEKHCSNFVSRGQNLVNIPGSKKVASHVAAPIIDISELEANFVTHGQHFASHLDAPIIANRRKSNYVTHSQNFVNRPISGSKKVASHVSMPIIDKAGLKNGVVCESNEEKELNTCGPYRGASAHNGPVKIHGINTYPVGLYKTQQSGNNVGILNYVGPITTHGLNIQPGFSAGIENSEPLQTHTLNNQRWNYMNVQNADFRTVTFQDLVNVKSGDIKYSSNTDHTSLEYKNYGVLNVNQSHPSVLNINQPHASVLNINQSHASVLNIHQSHASVLNTNQSHASVLNTNQSHASVQNINQSHPSVLNIIQTITGQLNDKDDDLALDLSMNTVSDMATNLTNQMTDFMPVDLSKAFEDDVAIDLSQSTGNFPLNLAQSDLNGEKRSKSEIGNNDADSANKNNDKENKQPHNIDNNNNNNEISKLANPHKRTSKNPKGGFTIGNGVKDRFGFPWTYSREAGGFVNKKDFMRTKKYVVPPKRDVEDVSKIRKIDVVDKMSENIEEVDIEGSENIEAVDIEVSENIEVDVETCKDIEQMDIQESADIEEVESAVGGLMDERFERTFMDISDPFREEIVHE